MEDSLSTRILIKRIQDGDHAARNELYERCQLPVLFLVRVHLGRKLRSKLESWDIVQEALLKSLNDLDSFQYERQNAFRRYLACKVRQVIHDQADYWSAAKRNPVREESFRPLPSAAIYDVDDVADDRHGQSPSELVSLDEDLLKLAEALDELADESPDTWDVVVAVKIVGSSLQEVADDHDTTRGAIKMKLQRGTLKLAKIYRKLQSGQMT